MGFSSARNLGRDISAGFSPPRRMPISEAVKKFMRVAQQLFLVMRILIHKRLKLI